MIETLWILLTTITYVIALEINECNRTVDARRKNEFDIQPRTGVTFKYSQSDNQARGAPYNCWYRLHGKNTQYVVVDVKVLVAGEYKSDRCQNGYLRISEEEVAEDKAHVLPPTMLCGDGPIRVKRLTRGSSAFVEFHVDYTDQTDDYVFDAMFIDKEPENKLPYGHVRRTDGRINSSFCDWLVPVDMCMGGCMVVTPGYPGIYPPNTVCRYTFMNFQNGRVEVDFNKFDLKRSNTCTDDYLVVYDGSSSKDVQLGRFCGVAHVNSLISSGTTMYMELHTGAGGPPYDYSGFELVVKDRWKNEMGFGPKESICDWSFASRDSEDGDLHTPDHMIGPDTTCLYKFTGQPGEVIDISVKSYELMPDCRESIEVMDGDKLLDKICSDRVGADRKSRSRGTSFKLTTTEHMATVIYRSMDGRLSNAKPNWIYYTFKNATDTDNTTDIPVTTIETSANREAIETYEANGAYEPYDRYENPISGTSAPRDVVMSMELVMMLTGLGVLSWS